MRQLASLHGILRHSPTNATWLLDDILNEVIALIDASAKRSAQVAVFARVLNEIATALSQLPVRPSVPKGVKAAQEGEEEEEEEEEEDEYLKPPLPEQVIAAKLLDRARHFVSSSVLAAQLDSLTCIGSCLRVLALTRKELLPACYSVWDPMMRRLEAWDPNSDDSNLVATKVFQVAAEMARLATDFLRGEKFERMWKTCSRMSKWALEQEATRPAFAAASFATSIEHRLVAAMRHCVSGFVAHCGVKDEVVLATLEKLRVFDKK